MAFGGGVAGRWLGHEGGSPEWGVTLSKEAREQTAISHDVRSQCEADSCSLERGPSVLHPGPGTQPRQQEIMSTVHQPTNLQHSVLAA